MAQIAGAGILLSADIVLPEVPTTSIDGTACVLLLLQEIGMALYSTF